MSSKYISCGVLTSSISRKAGGLYWSVRALSTALHQDKHKVQVYAGEDEFSSTDITAWGDVPLSIHPIIGPKSFGYQAGLKDKIKKSNHDIIHVHGIWMYPSVCANSWSSEGKPYIISPRGMLDSWAVNNSHIKKKIASFLYESKHLEQANCIHALCYSEYKSIRDYGLKNPVAIIPNGIDIPQSAASVLPEWENIVPKNSKILLFLSRIHPKKGLINLLGAWAEAKKHSSTNESNWSLVIAGWSQNDHQQELKDKAEELGILSSVFFVGPQFDEAKESTLSRADAFILPSFSEGLPMAVLEAWAYSLPVIMTPECNIPEGFETNSAIRVDPNVVSIFNGLTKLFDMSEKDVKVVGENGRNLVENKFSWPKIANEMLDVYNWVLDKNVKPDCVIID